MAEVPEERLSAERLAALQAKSAHDLSVVGKNSVGSIADLSDLLAHIDAQAATIADLEAERDQACERGAAYKREAAAWSKGVGEFVDEFAPTYCSEVACGPADLLPALPEIAERIRDRVRRAAAVTPKPGHTLVRDDVLAALGGHDQTGADHLADAVRLAEENDALRAQLAAVTPKLQAAQRAAAAITAHNEATRAVQALAGSPRLHGKRSARDRWQGTFIEHNDALSALAAAFTEEPEGPPEPERWIPFIGVPAAPPTTPAEPTCNVGSWTGIYESWCFTHRCSYDQCRAPEATTPDHEEGFGDLNERCVACGEEWPCSTTLAIPERER